MAYGMQTYDANGAIEFDSASPGGVFVEKRSIPTSGGTSGSPSAINYPQYAGRTIFLITLFAGDQTYYTDHSAGYPQIKYYQIRPAVDSARRNTSEVMVFVK